MISGRCSKVRPLTARSRYAARRTINKAKGSHEKLCGRIVILLTVSTVSPPIASAASRHEPERRLASNARSVHVTINRILRSHTMRGHAPNRMNTIEYAFTEPTLICEGSACSGLPNYSDLRVGTCPVWAISRPIAICHQKSCGTIGIKATTKPASASALTA